MGSRLELDDCKNCIRMIRTPGNMEPRSCFEETEIEEKEERGRERQIDVGHRGSLKHDGARRSTFKDSILQCTRPCLGYS